MPAAGPGISLNRHLADIPDEQVRKLFDPILFELMNLVDPSMSEGKPLRSLARQLLNPLELLTSPQSKSILIRLLPEVKRQELARRMELPADSTANELSELPLDSRQISKLLEFFGVEPEFRPQPEAPPSFSSVNPHYGLFDHQLRLVNEAWRKLENEPRTVVLHMPTGGGKTRSAMHLVAQHLRVYEPSVIVWLAHSRELLEQAASEFEKAWSFIGNRPVNLARMWGSYDTDPLRVKDGIIVAGLQKIHLYKQNNFDSFLKIADRAHLTVVDEAHISTAPTYRQVITGLWSKRRDNRLLGLTATPGRTWADISVDLELSELFHGQKVSLEIEGYSNPVSYLIDSGYLARPEFKLLNTEPGLKLTPDDRKALAERFEIPDTMLEGLGRNPLRNLKIVEAINELIKCHNRIIVFAPSVSSAESISAVLNVQNLKSLCITAQTNSIDRQRAINLYKSENSEPIILCNYGVLTAGFDAPKTSAAVIARPTLSLVLYSQMVGRALRGPKAGGNKTAEIITVVDPELPGFGKIEEAFRNWEDVWDGTTS